MGKNRPRRRLRVRRIAGTAVPVERALGPAIVILLAVAAGAACAGMDDGAVDYTEFSLSELLDMDVVYGASKHEQKVKDAPSAITIVTAEDIKVFGWRTLAEILGSLRGFYLTYDRDYYYLGARGFGRPGDYNSRILVLVDGNRINENVFDSAAIGNDFPLDVDLIERIEVVRGPSSSLYGTSAIFGIVNVVTKQGRQVDGVQVKALAGGFGTAGGRVTLGGGDGEGRGWDWLISGDAAERRGQDFAYPEFAGVFRDADREDWQHLQAQAGRGGAHFSALLGWQDKRIPTAPWETLFGDNRTKTMDNLRLLSAWYQTPAGKDRQYMGRLTYGDYEYEGAWVYDVAESEDEAPVPSIMADRAAGRWVNGETQATWNLAGGHLAAVGAEARRNFEQDQTVWDRDPYFLYMDEQRSSWTWAGYLMLEYRLAAWLRADAGLRHDRYESFGGTTNPRLALVAQPGPDTVLKALFGSAFRAPNMYEMYYRDSFTKPNPELGPERIKTLELVWDQSLGSCLHASLSGFYYRNRDLIEQQEDADDGLLVFRNHAEVRALGAEAELTGRWPSGCRAVLSYSYQDAEEVGDGDADDARLTNSPRHMIKGLGLVPLGSRDFACGLDVQYLSERLTNGGGTSGDYLVANLATTWDLTRAGLQIQAGVYNLLDRRYSHPGGVEHAQDLLIQDGRCWRVTATFSR